VITILGIAGVLYWGAPMIEHTHHRQGPFAIAGIKPFSGRVSC